MQVFLHPYTNKEVNKFVGDKINFPLNGKVYFQKGIEAFERGDRKEAVDCLDKAMHYSNSSEVNLYYAFVLSVYEEYEETLKVMNQMKDFYFENEKPASFYTEMLIKNENFIEAEHLIQNYQLNLTADEQLWKKLDAALDAERRLYNNKEKARKEELVKSLRILHEESSIVQSNKIREAEILELPALQEIAPLILSNYQIDAKVRRAYLELLARKNDENHYSFLWFDQIRKICPAKIETFDGLAIVHKLKNLLKEKLSKLPDLFYLIDTELTHDLLLLYPFIDEVIKDLDFWLDLYIVKFDFYNHSKITRIAVTQEELEMKETMEYLDLISQRFQKDPKN